MRYFCAANAPVVAARVTAAKARTVMLRFLE